MSKFLRRSLVIFIINVFWTIVFIFIVISTTFRLIIPPAFFKCLSSKFLRRSLVIFIINVFRTFVFIFIVISTRFRLICPPAFFRCLSNLPACVQQDPWRNCYRRWFPKLLRLQLSGCCRFIADCRRVAIQGLLTLVPGYS